MSLQRSFFIVFLLLLWTTANAGAALLLQPGFDQEQIGTVGKSTRAWGVAVADFDEDGIDDVISGDTFGDIHLFLGTGVGDFAHQGVVINRSFHDAYAVAAGDFNNDGFADFVSSRTASSSSPADDGVVQLYLGNGNGTFQSTGFPQQGIAIGDAGTDVIVLAAADVDGDGDLDLVAGDITSSDNGAADVTLFRNQLADTLNLSFLPETVISAVQLGPDPEQPPYFPPRNYLDAYGLAFGDVDGDGNPDLLVADRASYLYVYANDGTGSFTPIRYDRIATRPFAFARLHATFTNEMPLVAEDFNGDGMVDIAAGGDAAQWNGQVDLWLNTGNDNMGRPVFTGTGIVGGAGEDARGLAAGQLNSDEDAYADLVFGNFAGELYALFADLTDSDGDGIVDRFDNAPFIANAPRLDMNTDGGINHLDQLDNDFDGVGDPADADDDNDGVDDQADNCPFVANPEQMDGDGDGRGDACDPVHDADMDADGVPEWPTDPALRERAKQAKIRWSTADTHFILRIDALSRVFQNEFTQTMTDGAILSPEEWAVKKFDNYNGIGDAPAVEGYQVPEDLPGGMEVPIALITIPKQIWTAFGDPDPLRWINDRISDSDLEIGQHGTYHADNTPLGDWADQDDRNFYACETCGLTLAENLELLRIGKQTLLGEYGENEWILQSGAVPGESPTIDWSIAANPLISYAPPFNTSDPASRDAVARLGFLGFSASIFEERSPIFSPQGSHHEEFGPFGLYHASADLQVDPPEEEAGMTVFSLSGAPEGPLQKGLTYNWPHEESELPKGLRKDKGDDHPSPWQDAPGILKRQENSGSAGITAVAPQVAAGDYTAYLQSITEFGGLNTWLIEEVEWSTRYCNDLPRLVPCPQAPGGINRENNMVDPERWSNWLELLQFVKENGLTWTQGEYSLAAAYDNAPTVSNPDQADSDHDGIGDVVDGAELKAEKHAIMECQEESTLSARLSNGGSPLADQQVVFHYDADGDGSEDAFAALTGADGVASVAVVSSRQLGKGDFRATWDGIVTSAADGGKVTVVDRSPGPPRCPVPGRAGFVPAQKSG